VTLGAEYCKGRVKPIARQIEKDYVLTEGNEVFTLKPHRTLVVKVLLVAFLNLVLLTILFAIFARIQYRVDIDSFLLAPAHDRILAVGREVALDLRETDPGGWDNLLAQYAALHGVQFWLVDEMQKELAGSGEVLPPEISLRLLSSAKGHGSGDSTDERRKERKNERSLLFLRTTENPTRQWVAVRIPLPTSDYHTPARGALIAASSSWKGSLFFFDPKPWLAIVGAVLLISVLCWLPLVRGLTKSISQMTQATAAIAEGHFEVLLPEVRQDELGRLSSAINRMSSRLAGFVKGQKRFLGDTAHELCSPIARIQVALGILESKAGPQEQGTLADLREDVQHLSALVNEILSFSKADLRPAEVQLESVNLEETIEKVLARESRSGLQIEMSTDPGLRALAVEELLGRALSNMLRNSIRYAGHAGPIEINARTEDGFVMVRVSDRGPGIPEKDLEAVFEPFYRPAMARERETGGVGLGLAIVKTCVAACQGTVRCRNLNPTGLQVEITLKAG
jgi:two-component system, OmpR family, sensor histidine kinase CpxA